MKRRGFLAKGLLAFCGLLTTEQDAVSAETASALFSVDQIKQHAPIIYLYSKEKYYPEDPMDFIRASRLRHHRKFWEDQGWNKEKNRFETGNSRAAKFYNISLKTINSFKLHKSGKNRRPRDNNSGRDTDVFLQPEGARRGNRALHKVPVFYRTKKIKDKKDIDSVIQYWCFFGYNQSPVTVGPFGSFAHQGDWEHVDIAFKGKNPIWVYFSAHGRSKKVKYKSAQKDKSGRVIAFAANGSHGMYSSKGKHTVKEDVALGYKHSFTDIANAGTAWDLSRKLADLTIQPWKDFAGAWGEVGQFAGTTGPLGPYLKNISY